MKEYVVNIPFAGYAEVLVEADSKEEAQETAQGRAVGANWWRDID